MTVGETATFSLGIRKKWFRVASLLSGRRVEWQQKTEKVYDSYVEKTVLQTFSNAWPEDKNHTAILPVPHRSVTGELEKMFLSQINSQLEPR